MFTYAKTSEANKTEIYRDGVCIGVIRKEKTGYRVSLRYGIVPAGGFHSPANWATTRTLKEAKQVIEDTLSV